MCFVRSRSKCCVYDCDFFSFLIRMRFISPCRRISGSSGGHCYARPATQHKQGILYMGNNGDGFLFVKNSHMLQLSPNLCTSSRGSTWHNLCRGHQSFRSIKFGNY